MRAAKNKGDSVKYWSKWNLCAVLAVGACVLESPTFASQSDQATARDGMSGLSSIQGKSMSVEINSDGSYSIKQAGIPGTVMRSDVEADTDSGVLRSSAYPQHKTAQSDFHDEFGSGSVLSVTHAGLEGKPDLVCTFRLYKDQSWGDLEVKVLNTTGRVISVQAIRTIHATDAPVISLNGAVSADRILSDSYSEDRPQLAILDLGHGRKGVHRAFQSQLIYNRESGQSLFIGALTSDRLLTIFHLKEQG